MLLDDRAFPAGAVELVPLCVPGTCPKASVAIPRGMPLFSADTPLTFTHDLNFRRLCTARAAATESWSEYCFKNEKGLAALGERNISWRKCGRVPTDSVLLDCMLNSLGLIA